MNTSVFQKDYFGRGVKNGQAEGKKHGKVGRGETLAAGRPIIRTLLQTAQARDDEVKRHYGGQT